MRDFWKDEAPIEVCHVQTVAEFANALDRGSDDWGWNRAVQRSEWIFRGHGDAAWPLLPVAWRKNGRPTCIEAALGDADSRIPADTEVVQLDDSGSLPFPAEYDRAAGRQVVVQANAELALLAEFLHRADAQGIHIPGKLPPEFHARGSYSPDRPVAADDFLGVGFSDEQAALAQHHGVPTRLLDWTDDPLVAAYFAVSTATESERVAVWALSSTVDRRVKVHAWADAGWEIRIVRPPRAPNPFLRAQRGIFTICFGAALFALLHDGDFPTLEDFARAVTPTRPVLRKVTLPATERAAVLNWLERQHVSRTTLMPSLDHIAAAVCDRWAGTIP